MARLVFLLTGVANLVKFSWKYGNLVKSLKAIHVWGFFCLVLGVFFVFVVIILGFLKSCKKH